MVRSPLKPHGLLVVILGIVFMGYPGAAELTLDEVCTKLITRSHDLRLQGITSDGNSLTIVVNDHAFTIPQTDEYLNNTNPKLALFSRGSSTQIVDKGQINTTGFFKTVFDGSVPIRNGTLYSLMLLHYVPHEKDHIFNAMFRKTDLESDAPNWIFLDKNVLRSLDSSLYGYVSDTQPGLKRSFVLRPLKKNDYESRIVMSTGDNMFHLSFDILSATLTISTVISEDGTEDETTEKESDRSLVAKLPMVGIICGDKVHLWNTYSGQVFVYDYKEPSLGGSVEVSAYSFEQYFACNEDQWNSISQTAQPVLDDSQRSSDFLNIIVTILLILWLDNTNWFDN